MPFNDADRGRLHECLALAHRAIGLSDPNPRVGCVIGSAGGRTLAQGFTQQAGGPHAEAAALANAHAAGADLRGATAWVSLEPCAHHGRTPPCCEALIDAGIARVVVAAVDPNPLVAGQGIARLRAAGVTVDLAEGDTARAARELNIGFFARMQRGRPWVRMKIAASLDGRTALNNGASQWITGDAARTDGHHWRKRASALLTGIGTVLEDNPRLDVRWVPTPRQPLRVIVDSRLQTPADARILDAPGEVRVYFAAGNAAREKALRERGARLVPMAADHGKVDLAAMLSDLAQRGINELHVEAGAALNGALLAAGLVDEWMAYIAPLAVGDSARGLFAQPPLTTLADAARFKLSDVRHIGNDLRLTLLPQ